MKYRMILALVALSLAACGGGKNNGGTNNGTAGTNNGTTAGTNNGTTAGTNNGTTAGTNNGTTTGTNNGTTTGVVDFISADVDGTAVVADSDEGGIEPMGATVQLRKTTGDAAAPVQIFRLTVPNTEVASYDCANDDVLVEYIELDGQLATTWVAADTCTIEVTEGGSNAGDVVVGSFTASATDGATTVELTNGEFRLTN